MDGGIYGYLTHPILDPTSSGRVVMDYLMKLVTTALEWMAARGETDVTSSILQEAAQLLTRRRDATSLIEGEPDETDTLSPTRQMDSASSAGKERYDGTALC